MKTYLRHKLSKFGLLPLLNSLRNWPDTKAWLAAGCKGIAPPIKHKVLTGYLQCYGLKQFTEAGPHLDETLSYIAQNKTVEAISIELDDPIKVKLFKTQEATNKKHH